MRRLATHDWEGIDVNIGSCARLVGVSGDELFEGATVAALGKDDADLRSDSTS